jgi:hypothetical protein
MNTQKIILLGSLLAIVNLMVVNVSAQQTKPDTLCARYQVIAEFKKVVVSNMGDIEPIHTNEGLAVLVTAKDSGQIEAIQNAAKKYVKESKAISVTKANTPCTKIIQAIKDKKISEGVINMSKGVLVTLVSQDPSLVKLLHKSGCCDYCICPTHITNCAGCC